MLLTHVKFWLDIPSPDWNTIRPLFQSFLSTHIKLVEMDGGVPYEHFTDLIHDITTLRKELRVLHIWYIMSRKEEQTID